MRRLKMKIDQKMDKNEEEAAFLLAMRLAAGSVVPMALKSAMELDLLQLIKKSGAGASASELAAQLPTTNPNAADMIDRILRLLAAHSVLTCTLPHGGVERRYSLAPVCKFLTADEDGVSCAPMSFFVQDKVTMESWYHMSDAILKGGVPFERAHGMGLFEYAAQDSRLNKVFNEAMRGPSTVLMKRMLEIYKGFEGVKSLVDVGGGTGATLKLIVSKFPSIKAINFDLPHVIQHNPPHPGVEHVGGDMFVSVPRADAIFMKWICHDWSDAECLKLLRNCYSALPENGKVVIAECILPENPNNSMAAVDSMEDVAMLSFTPSGRERTEKEFRALAHQAGFPHFIRSAAAFNTWIMELHKSN